MITPAASAPSYALLVEDLPHVRAGLRRILERAFDGVTVHEAGDIASAKRLLNGTRAYRLALIDLVLPDGSGLSIIRMLREASPETLSIVTTVYDDDAHIFSAIAAGADGYVLKEQAPEALLKHLQALEQGVPALSPAVARRMLAHFRASPTRESVPVAVSAPVSTETSEAAPSLSPRETEVLSLIARGLQRNEVATLLGISENTVARYLKDVYRKLGISSRAEAALAASARGLV